VTGFEIASKLGAELDVVVARKLRSPWNSELAIGAIAEGGRSYLTPMGKRLGKENPEYIKREMEEQSQEIANRVSRLRKIKPRADWAHRTLIVTDDGMATGSTFFAVLDVLRAENPMEIIAALPVLPKDKVRTLAKRCDKSIFLMSPEDFVAVGQFYETFEAVEFDKVESLLKENGCNYVAKKNQTN
jgi:predicted phosphoribosyltransferase